MTVIAPAREQVFALMQEGQARLCAAFEHVETQHLASPPHTFAPASWQRPGGSGGTARVLTEGAVFERAGVNVSAVYGDVVPAGLAAERPHLKGQPYFATGVSLVLHPRNPYVPAFHANLRYFEAGGDWWFGGGMDLTPSYGFAEDARQFHSTLRAYCERHAVVDYREVKGWCDDYFFLKHRGEMRGIGGIFFDGLTPAGDAGFERALDFVGDGVGAIIDAYLPVVRRRMHTPYGERERQWQLYRRGRYVEFNLVYDKGTTFGLQTNGYTEAILMSMPPLARWEFEHRPEAGSPEAELAHFLTPQEWA